jgi:RNA 2',3'-cyclic 3'-phosphodiesterase
MRAALLATMEGVAGARWQDGAQLHLTLCFVGEASDEQAEAIADMLHRVQGPPLELALAGVGTFARKGAPHALWAGVVAIEGVTALAAKVRRALRLAGVEPERGAFVPHITVARLNRSSGPINGWVAAHALLTSEVAQFDRFGLYESVLRPEGSEYHLLADYGLG